MRTNPANTTVGIEGEVAIDDVATTRERLRDEARRRLGVTGNDGGAAPSLRRLLSDHSLSVYPLTALGSLAVVDTFHSYAFAVLAPEVSSTLGVSKSAIAGVLAAKTITLALAPLPFAAAVQRHPRRALLSVMTAFAWSLVAILTGFVTAIWGLLFVLVLDGLTTASVGVLHPPLLMDSYPPEGRVRVLSRYQAANSAGNILAPIMVAVLSVVFGFTWRGVFVVLGLVSVIAAAGAVRLKDPGFGRFDTQRVRSAVRPQAAGGATHIDVRDITLRFSEIVRRLTLIGSIRRLLVAQAVFGILLVPYQTFIAFFLDERWNLGPGERGVFTAYLGGVAVIALSVFGKRGENLFRKDPAALVRLASTLLGAGVVVIALAALAPNFAVMCALFGLSAALLAVLAPSLQVAIFSVMPAHMRPHAAALMGIAIGVGGISGAIMLGGVERRYGIVGTIVSLAVPGVLGAILLRRTGSLVPRDMDRMIDETLEEEEIRQIESRGGHLPLLSCRGLEFAYDQIQVLFGVDFTVDDGEMVALLGTNGAGKSTLLRAISGIGLPTAGSVRLQGHDITHLDAERRVGLGITQVPGGRGVFESMNVVDNLRAFAYTIGRDRQALTAGMAACFDAFPQLAQRRNQPASTLSGGEQQMLALSKAFLLRPRLLLIDELSLGLSPLIVGQLLELVKRINARGTAVVLVEQSVNIALELVDHAYYMEKGEIAFDGPSDELLNRDDLLRAVFLQGVNAGVHPNGSERHR